MTRISPAVSTATAVGGAQAAAPATAVVEAAPPAPTEPVAPFHPPLQRSQRGLASRSWIPVALSFGTVIIVAVALVIYFSQHT